jgi:hypothetical protein
MQGQMDWFLRARTQAGSQSGAPDNQPPSDPLATPDFFPMKIDTQRNTMLFIQMSRESFRQSAFLDRRAVRTGRTTLSASIPKLLQRQAVGTTHFILHGAFCGSTLLGRYLEELPRCFVLKEPGILGQLSYLKNNPPAASEPDAWGDWFRVTLALLARAYRSDGAVIVKAPDLCNWMGNLLLDNDDRTKVVFLFSPLRVFLLQVLKVAHRRQWLREHMQQLSRQMTQVPFLSAIVATDLTDGQCAAAMWLLNSFLCSTLLARLDSHRILVLNGERLISNPKECVFSAADFLNLINDDADRAALETLRPLSYHSKDAQLPYDAATRSVELADAETRYGSEVQAAMMWADVVSLGWLTRSPLSIE